jgi:adenylate cyclase
MVFSLQKRFLLVLMLPVTLILLATAIASFVYARSYLLEEWKSVTKLRLEKTSHQIQMRLDRVRSLIDLIVRAQSDPRAEVLQAFLSHQISGIDGVRSVEILPIRSNEPVSNTSHGRGSPAPPAGPPGGGVFRSGVAKTTDGTHQFDQDCGPGCAEMPMNRMMRSVNELSFDESHDHLSIIKPLGTTNENQATKIEGKIAFDSLMKGLLELGDWQYSYACLVKSDGTYLAHTDSSMKGLHRLGDAGDPLKKLVFQEIKTREFGTVLGAGHPPHEVIGFYHVPTTDWYVVLVSDCRAVLPPIARFRFNYIIVGMISLACVGMLIHWNTQPIALSVTEIAKAAEEVENGNFSLEVEENRSDEIGLLKRRFNKMIRGLKQRDLIERTFGRYVDRTVAAELLTRPESLLMGGSHQTVTILMADIRGFTRMCEKLTPTEVIAILNRHFSQMIEVIQTYKGIIVDFYGDSVLVFFGSPNEDTVRRALDAVRCALAIQERLEAVSKRNMNEGLPELSMGIGIHTGEVVVGNIGSETRAKYGIVGSAVNETDRIQSLASGRSVMISDKTYQLVGGRIRVGSACQACLKGFDGVRDLYEVGAINEEMVP